MTQVKNKPLVVGVVIGAVVIMVLLGLLLFLPNKKSKNSSGQTTQIKMNADGFAQTEITINKGETIEWVNQDEDFRWPASNIHPSHEIYPEFDPKEPIPPGQSWSFTFDKPGKWQFHDHLKPYFVGTITVVE